MDVQRYLWWIVLLLSVPLAACSGGGSGSSGFDAFPEDAAISRALQEQRCIARESLTICPAGEGSAAPAATPSPGVPAGSPGPGMVTPTPALMRIDTGLDPRLPLRCTPQLGGAGCVLTVPFVPEGFADASFRAAVRTLDPDGLWTFGAEPALQTGAGAPAFDATTTVNVDSRTVGTLMVQVAVLVFEHAPGPLPPLQELVDSGARFAFVSPPLALQPQPSD